MLFPLAWWSLGTQHRLSPWPWPSHSKKKEKEHLQQHSLQQLRQEIHTRLVLMVTIRIKQEKMSLRGEGGTKQY